ncbi:Aryl-alcohol dehydrogenase [NADP(+)] [Psilocybe cubensis]|uniref:Aryl-alcohol dehydrogenase [NADP(+)] n=1 Tax=Psilocybe cubensis TaxID=181762 RepID=A0ACB8GX72_PSICU|nr:Aryl-alcohol dehydrogenase [NADP(+)] [Psilocybe cubensis]KAH9480231.1 Aryl-alcohol dehydrogenase [NADP(+)] [Psilocybe cubensis]
MAFYSRPPPPPTGLARYRLLSPTAGVHVSPIQLGAMSIGDAWANLGMGSMDKESSFKLLDAYYDNGGNFIDTANNYQDGTSELFIGEWAEKRGIRDRLFIATKYTNNFRARDPNATDHKILFAGNNSKSLKLSFKESLKRLRTDYVDLLYVHWWDWDTGVEEVMRALHHLVASGQVLYLGISDTPAWVVVKANAFARANSLTPFVIYQGAWNVLDRAFEREIIPMARSEGMALAPWNVVASGKFRTDAEEEERAKTGEKGRTIFSPEWLRNDNEKKVSAALEKVAQELGVKHITSVAIAYVLHKTSYVFPIIGGRKVEHLLANVEALDISLTAEQIKYLESVVPFDAGFPHNMVGDGTFYRSIWEVSGHLDRQPLPQAITPIAKKV